MTSTQDNSALLLRSKKYAVFWAASLLSNIGTWMQQVAEPWLVLSISGSPFLLGLDAFAVNGPFWMLTLFGGVLADRRDRASVIFFFQGIQMLCLMLIVILVATGWIRVWMIIVFSLIAGTTDALSMPAFASLIPSIIRRKDLGRAIALNSMQFNLARILGPAIAGLVMLQYGPVWCFSANAISFIPFFLSIYWLLPSLEGAQQQISRQQHQTSLFEGFKAIIRNAKSGWALLSVFATSFFCSPIIAFSPVVVKEVLHADVGQFGGVLTAFGIGGIMGPLLILLTSSRLSPMKLSLIAALFYGLFVMGVSGVGTTWQLASILVGSGFLLTVANASANTFLQSCASDDNRGQTASLFMLAMRGGLSVGDLITGSMTSLLGVQHALLINGILAVIIQIFIFWKMFRREARLHNDV